MKHFILIGYGNLAYSMMQGFANSQDFGDKQFLIYGRDFAKSQAFASHFPNAQAISSLEESITPDSTIILCIKPKGIESLHISKPFYLLYSVMAGVKLSTLQDHFLKAQNLTRAMPNIGAKVQKSSTTFYTQGSNEAKKLSDQITASFGTSLMLDNEDLIDSSIATNGSSPAFIALAIEALIDAGVREGIPYQQSFELVTAMLEGVSELLRSHTPQELKTLITSPGGTTAEGLAHLENHSFRGILQEAAHRSVLKAKGKI